LPQISVQVVIFFFLALVVCVAGVVATFARNIVNSAYALFFALLGLAGVYVLLGADFLAITQVVIYVGGILVLLLFGVLLTNRSLEDLTIGSGKAFIIATVAGGVVFVILCTIVGASVWPEAAKPNLEGTTKPIGILLLQNYLLPFEFSSVTLLAALIGAAYLVRRKDQD
jgi:NADH:ubiquinone oxidoreductase subunit 6 (subunit J)